MSYPKTGEEVYVSLNLSNTMLTGLGKGTITREDVSVDYLKKLFEKHGVIVSAKPEYRNIMERVNKTYDLGLELDICMVARPALCCRPTRRRSLTRRPSRL